MKEEGSRTGRPTVFGVGVEYVPVPVSRGALKERRAKEDDEELADEELTVVENGKSTVGGPGRFRFLVGTQVV